MAGSKNLFLQINPLVFDVAYYVSMLLPENIKYKKATIKTIRLISSLDETHRITSLGWDFILWEKPVLKDFS